jgi:PAS domain S-box-containing protein
MQPSEDLWRGLVATLPDALLAIDTGGLIMFVSDHAEQLFNWSATELVGRSIDRLVPQRFIEFNLALQAAYRPEQSTRELSAGLRLRARRRDGSEFPAAISLSAFEVNSHRVVAAVIRDESVASGEIVGTVAEAQHEASATPREQSQLFESLGQLAAGVAHDFNNLLGVILNYQSLAARAADDPTQASDLLQIRVAAERATALTRQLSTFSGRDAVTLEPLELNEVVRSRLATMGGSLGEHIDLQAQLDPRPLWALADRDQLDRVVHNLILNARDAMPGGGRLLVRTAGSAQGTGGLDSGIVLDVIDDGIGMSAAVLARAFEPFFTTKPRGDGNGLGLATVYGIVTQHGGHVTLSSTLGAGTTATVRLRHARPDPDETTLLPVMFTTPDDSPTAIRGAFDD